jgi:hypothetical protein
MSNSLETFEFSPFLNLLTGFLNSIYFSDFMQPNKQLEKTNKGTN